MAGYEQFNEESIIQAQNSYFFKNSPFFDIKTPLPMLVHDKRAQGPNAFIEMQPPNTFEVYDPRFNANYFQNQYNKENIIYISRSYCGGFWLKEFNPIMAHFLISQEEFEKIIKKTEKIAGGFSKVKCFYLMFFVILLIGLILIIVGGCYSSETSTLMEDISYYNYLVEITNVSVAVGTILIVVDVTLLILTVFCTLKKYEFEISKYFLKINQKKFLLRNIYWKIGGFCRFIQIQILPFTPQQFWLMQAQEKKLKEEEEEKKKKENKK